MNISAATEKSAFLEAAQHLSKIGWKKRTHFGSFAPPPDPVISLSMQRGSKTGTITLSSDDVKSRVLEYHGTGWELDDKFDGLTVLHSADSPDLE